MCIYNKEMVLDIGFDFVYLDVEVGESLMSCLKYYKYDIVLN